MFQEVQVSNVRHKIKKKNSLKQIWKKNKSSDTTTERFLSLTFRQVTQNIKFIQFLVFKPELIHTHNGFCVTNTI